MMWEPSNLSVINITGDPLHSRAACTQPCNVNTHSRAHCSPGARLCEQWGHGCVNNGARLCACARLCRGSPVNILSSQWDLFIRRETSRRGLVQMIGSFAIEVIYEWWIAGDELWYMYCWPSSWWRHQTETFSALLAICAGNSPVTGEFPAQRPVTRSFDVFFYLRLNNGWVNNREAGAIAPWPIASPEYQQPWGPSQYKDIILSI